MHLPLNRITTRLLNVRCSGWSRRRQSNCRPELFRMPSNSRFISPTARGERGPWKSRMMVSPVPLLAEASAVKQIAKRSTWRIGMAVMTAPLFYRFEQSECAYPARGSHDRIKASWPRGFTMLCFQLTIALALAGPLLAQQHNVSPPDVENGGRIYNANCFACPGQNGDLVPGVDLRRAPFRRLSSAAHPAPVLLTRPPRTPPPPTPPTP